MNLIKGVLFICLIVLANFISKEKLYIENSQLQKKDLLELNHINQSGVKKNSKERIKKIYVEVSQLLSFGHQHVLSNLLYLSSIQNFAKQLENNNHSKWALYQLYDALDWMFYFDPMFEDVFVWAGAVLMYNQGDISENKIEMSNRVLHRVWNYRKESKMQWQHSKSAWLIPHMIAFNYDFELGDPDKAIPLYRELLDLDQTPDVFKTTYAQLLAKHAKKSETSYAYYKSILKFKLKEIFENQDFIAFSEDNINQTINQCISSHSHLSDKQLYENCFIKHINK